MYLNGLKYWRELRGYSVRELAEKSSVAYPTISLLENLKREPQRRNTGKLAVALGVEINQLYEEPPVAQAAPVQTPPPQSLNDNKTLTIIKPARPTRAKKQQQPVGNCWVIDFEGDAFGPFVLADAERLQEKLGGWHKARVYKAESKAEANEQHRQFLIRVIRGHDAW